MDLSDPPDKYKILGLTGMPGSGKGEVCTIARELHLPVRSMGDIVRRFFADNCPGRDPKETGIFANDERDRHGKDVWARRLVEEVEVLLLDGNLLILIDGIRSGNEVEVFRDRWDDRFLTLCIHSSPGSRYSRLKERARNDDPVKIEDFEDRDLRELGWGLGNVIARADMMIVNEGDRDDLKDSVIEVLKRLME